MNNLHANCNLESNLKNHLNLKITANNIEGLISNETSSGIPCTTAYYSKIMLLSAEFSIGIAPERRRKSTNIFGIPTAFQLRKLEIESSLVHARECLCFQSQQKYR